ncbi:MAG: tetratricopeptide repeat protein [Kangiellaceae bacterium]|nr:tetratricopeptide repeat protein [Kangiellaceae bacterium]
MIRTIAIIALFSLLTFALKTQAEQDLSQVFIDLESKKTSNPRQTKELLDQLELKYEKLSLEQQSLYKIFRAHSLVLQGNYVAARQELDQVIDQTSFVKIKARAHSMLSNVLLFSGELEQAFEHSKSALQLLPKLKEQDFHRFAVLQNAASLFKQAGVFGKAMDYSRQLLIIAEQSSDPIKQCVSHYEMANWELQASQLEILEERIQQLNDACQQAKDPIFQALAGELQARYFLHNNHSQKAYEVLAKWQKDVDEMTYLPIKTIYAIRLGETYLALDDIDKASVYLGKGYQAAKKANDKVRIMEAAKHLATIHSKNDKLKESIDLYKEYLDLEKQLEVQTNQRKLAYFTVSMRN